MGNLILFITTIILAIGSFIALLIALPVIILYGIACGIYNKTLNYERDIKKIREEKELALWQAFHSIEIKMDPKEVELNKKIQEINKHLSLQKVVLTQANQMIISLLREALDTKEYQASKEDINNLSVKTLQKIALVIWNHLEMMDGYLDLGREVIKEFGINSLKELYDQKKYVRRQSFLKKVNEIIERPSQILQLIVGQRGWFARSAQKFDNPFYDSYLVTSNYPSVQEKKIVEGVVISRCWGGCAPNPEFLALLQLVKNNKQAAEKDPDIPGFIFYVNFQNIGKEGKENLSSLNLMKLNENFSDIFLGITLSKDSNFYKNSNDRPWRGAIDFGIEMKRHLMDGSSFSLHGREHHIDGGYYFPGKYEFWEEIFDQIIEKANCVFDSVPEEVKLHARQQELRGAYQEYVYSMLQTYIEKHLAKNTNALMTICASGENDLRTSLENIKYLSIHLEDEISENEGFDLIAGVLFNSFSNHSQKAYADRIPQIFAFMKYVDRKAFNF